MGRIIKALGDSAIDGFFNVFFFIEDHLKDLALILNMMLPYAMLYIGQDLGIARGKVAFGWELLVPVFIGLLIYLTKGTANRLGKGTTMPIPIKRFTQETDVETFVPTSRTQELILYMADLENWLERNGLLKSDKET